MTMLTWLADVLRAGKLTVVEEDGWKTRGRGPMGTVRGVMLHHTAGPRKGNSPSLRIVRDGREGLPGPLSQLFLCRDGTYHVVAAGRSNHAGEGTWHGASGNSQFIGIEAENCGDGTDPWPEVQMEAYEDGVAALLNHLGADSVMAVGHKEYATPRGRKIDPSFDMVQFRENVDQLMKGGFPRRVVNASEPTRSMLSKGDRGQSVILLQSLLRIPQDGQFGPATEAAVKAFQLRNHLDVDGRVGPRTWKALGPKL